MPKSNSEDLFHLIKSLSKSEKRHFKIFSSNGIAKKENNYVKLFDAIERQAIYDEDQLIKKEKYIKQLPLLKSRLYEIILQSLNVLHANSSVEAILMNYQHRIEILYEKGLHQQAHKLLNKAKQMAYKYEKHSNLFEIFSWERAMIHHLFAGKKTELQKGFDEIFEEKNKSLSKLGTMSSFQHVSDSILALYTEKGSPRNNEELKSFRQAMDPFSNYKTDHLTYEEKKYYYSAYGSYFYAIEDWKNSHENFQEVVKLIESHPEKKEKSYRQYISLLSNLLTVCQYLRKDDEILLTLKKMRKIPITSLIDEVKIFERSYNFELSYYILSGDFEKGLHVIKDIEAGLQKFKNHLNSALELVLYDHISNIYFGIGQYKKALFWLNKILNYPEFNLREDVYCYARIYNLIIHYELDNNDLMEYTVKSTFRFLHKRNRLYKFENIILDFIGKKLPKLISSKQQIFAFKELKKKLEIAVKDPYEEKALDYFDFISWLKSKIENRSFAEIVKEKAYNKNS